MLESSVAHHLAMSSSCIVPGVHHAVINERSMKRVRSASLLEANEPVNSVLKVVKREGSGSPRSACEILSSKFSRSVSISAKSATSTSNVSWPEVTSSEGLRNAIQFLQRSRQHAKLLMLENHWERAMTVLEKVEKAAESVYKQRRRLVLQQANQIVDMLVGDDPAGEQPDEEQRRVRFCDDVQVDHAIEMDRTASDVESPVREEMLVLNASRSIPCDNYSEMWL